MKSMLKSSLIHALIFLKFATLISERHLKKVREFYDNIAKHYDEKWWYNNPDSRHVKVFTSRFFGSIIRSWGLILDVGCGTCDTGIQLASKECKVVGVDLSSKMLLVAADKIPKDLKTRVFLTQGIAENLAFHDNQFDYVISEFSLDYLNNPKVALKEFTRVLKKGGRLLFIVSNRRPLYIMFWEFLIGNWGFIKQLKHRQDFLTFPYTGVKVPFQRYTPDEINDLISDLPIKTLGVFGTHGISGFLGYPLILLGLFIMKMRKRGAAFKDIDHYVKIKGDYLIFKIFKIFEKIDQRFNNIGRDILFVGEKL